MKTIAAFGFIASSLAISITSPNSNDYWVQATSNVINWSFSSGDPNPVDITITNSNSSFLNGAFSIARNLDASNGTFTVTNVTLRVAQGYVVNFVNGTNSSQIFASSQQFEVKKPGTAKSGNGNATATASGSSASSTSPNASGSGSSGSGSPTASSSRGAAANSSGAAVHTITVGFLGQGVPALIASALMALLSACVMF